MWVPRKSSDVEETDGEDINRVVQETIKTNLGIEVTDGDIDVAHRLGNISDNKPRMIICRFTNRHLRNKVLRKRRELKGKACSVAPDLTAPRALLIKELKSKYPDKTVNGKRVIQTWNDFNGRIWRKVTDRRIEEIFPKKFPGIMSSGARPNVET